MSADNYDGGKNTGKGKSADKFELNPKFRESKGSKGADHFEHTMEGGCRGSLVQIGEKEHEVSCDASGAFIDTDEKIYSLHESKIRTLLD